jgi:hypothetical protein
VRDTKARIDPAFYISHHHFFVAAAKEIIAPAD